MAKKPREDHDQRLFPTEPYQEGRPLVITTFERGVAQGVLQGIPQGERQRQLATLEAKFGPLSAETQKRLQTLSSDELLKIMLEFYKVSSLKALGLED